MSMTQKAHFDLFFFRLRFFLGLRPDMEKLMDNSEILISAMRAQINKKIETQILFTQSIIDDIFRLDMLKTFFKFYYSKTESFSPFDLHPMMIYYTQHFATVY